MNAEKKAEWKCQNCRKCKLNTAPLTPDGTNLPKQQKDTDPLSINELNVKLCTVQSDLSEIKTTIQTLSLNINANNLKIREDIQSALSKVSSAITTLTTQVTELNDKTKENVKKIEEMEVRINKLEQNAINKNIVINNIQNSEMSASDVIKKVASSLNISLNNDDISNAYKIKKNNKIIIEFTTINKKKELMGKLKGNKLNSNIFNTGENNMLNNSNANFIYINDDLTAINRRLLWIAKTRAKECLWKFIWVRNGNIFARKAENSPAIVIKNAADIESIN